MMSALGGLAENWHFQNGLEISTHVGRERGMEGGRKRERGKDRGRKGDGEQLNSCAHKIQI